MDDAAARELHSRAARGTALTVEEQAKSDAWYRRKDDDEARMLAASASSSAPQLETLRREVDAALSRLTTAAEQVQTLSQENETLRQELADLRERLRWTTASKAAA